MSWSLWTRRPHHADLNWMREGVLCISWSVRFSDLCLAALAFLFLLVLLRRFSASPSLLLLSPSLLHNLLAFDLYFWLFVPCLCFPSFAFLFLCFWVVFLCFCFHLSLLHFPSVASASVVLLFCSFALLLLCCFSAFAFLRLCFRWEILLQAVCAQQRWSIRPSNAKRDEI